MEQNANMSEFTPLIICSDEDESDLTGPVLGFDNQQIDIFGFDHEQVLDSLIFRIMAEPGALQVHLQRIFFCYQHDLGDDLFAALADFLIVLEGRGAGISRRMVRGAKSKLQSIQYLELEKALKLDAADIKLLKGNVHSVFTQGLIGVTMLIEKEAQAHGHEHDPLDLARDYIAYSQLDTAMETLEEAILVDFGRQELHDDLLELYRLTQSKDRFLKMHDTLKAHVENIPDDWNELKGFFNDR